LFIEIIPECTCIIVYTTITPVLRSMHDRLRSAFIPNAKRRIYSFEPFIRPKARAAVMKTIHHIINLIVLLTCLSSGLFAQAEEELERGFDHFTTGFPLTGRHEIVECSSCHLFGQFAGTPKECHLCHNGSRAPGKHPQHPPSGDFCDDCHTVYSWTGARYDHFGIMDECLTCHNNSIAVGKSASHIASTDTCEDCHNTITFSQVARVDHTAVIGTCESCHNGVIATGKTADHIYTIASCDFCHFSTITWLGAVFDHSTVTGACSSCHNGVTATGKPADHIPTTDECGYCHTTDTWSGAIEP
jgi:hypothetical protein